MAHPAIVTNVTRNYLHYAQALAISVRDVHPEIPVYICLADRPPVEPKLHSSSARLFFADELGIADWRRFAFQYTPYELTCALKPFAIDYVHRQGHDRVIYFDSDIQVYSSLELLLNRLDAHDILLAPHLEQPLEEDEGSLDEETILRAGSFNGGFLAVKRSETGAAFLNWWKRKHRKSCITDVASGMTVDQRWLDLVPGLFDGVHIERHVGVNVAYWNLRHRPLRRQPNGRWTAKDQPMMFFHFSGWRPAEPLQLSVFQQRDHVAEQPILMRLLTDYHNRLETCQRVTCESWGCQFNTLSDGTPIRPAWREAVRLDYPKLADIEDPFQVDQVPDLVQRYCEAEPHYAKARKDWLIESVLAVPPRKPRSAVVRRLEDIWRNIRPKRAA